MHPILEFSFLNNRWLWFHILGAAVLFRIGQFWYTDQQAFVYVLGIAVAWELLRFLTTQVNKTYGSMKRFLLDSIGDIAGAVAIMLILILINPEAKQITKHKFEYNIPKPASMPPGE